MKSSRYQQTTLLPEDRLDSDLETWEQWQEEGQQILKAAGYRIALTNRPQGAAEDRLLGDAALNAFEGWFLDDEAMRHDPFMQQVIWFIGRETILSRFGSCSRFCQVV